jgi:hypothetical protein
MMPSRTILSPPPDAVPSRWEPRWESWWPPYQPPTEAPTANLPPGAAELIATIPDDLSIPDFLKRPSAEPDAALSMHPIVEAAE